MLLDDKLTSLTPFARSTLSSSRPPWESPHAHLEVAVGWHFLAVSERSPSVCESGFNFIRRHWLVVSWIEASRALLEYPFADTPACAIFCLHAHCRSILLTECGSLLVSGPLWQRRTIARSAFNLRDPCISLGMSSIECENQTRS